MATATNGRNRRCIVVFGMHRSGTSALTRVLNLFGATLPHHVMGAGPSNEKGHWEPERLVHLHEAMLQELGSSWCDWRTLDVSKLPPNRLHDYRRAISEIIEQEFGDSELFVIKDPRVCRFAALMIEILQDMDVEPVAIHVLRNPLAVAHSLETRDGLGHEVSYLLWLSHVLKAEKDTRRNRRAVISYDALMEDWRGCMAKCAALLDLPAHVVNDDAIGAEIDAFLTEGLQHHRETIDDLRSAKDISRWVTSTYEAMLQLEKNAGDEQSLDILDEIAGQFQEAVRLFGSIEVSTSNAAADDPLATLKTEDAAVVAPLISTVDDDAIEAELATSIRIARLRARLMNDPADLDAMIRLSMGLAEQGRFIEAIAIGQAAAALAPERDGLKVHLNNLHQLKSAAENAGQAGSA